jgi:hypothetical protein
MAFTQEYKTKIHEALLVKVWSENTTAPGTGYIILPDDTLDDIISSKDKETVKSKLYHQTFVYKASTVEQTQNGNSAQDATQVFVKLGLFLAILNKQLKKATAPYISFEIDSGDNFYRTIDGHISIDPQVCLLPSTLQSLLDGQEGFDPPLVYDVLLNINAITRILDEHTSRDASVALLDFFESLFSEVERVTGVINKYELQYYEESSTFTVVDRNHLSTVPKSKLPQINIFGLNSIVKNVGLVSKISPKISSMIAISAQDSPFTTNMEGTGFNALSKDLEQSITNTIEDDSGTIDSVKIEAATTTYEQMLEAFEKDMIVIFAHVNAIYGVAKVLNLTDAYTVSSLYQNYCNMVIGKKQDPAYSFIIPFELNLALHGMSGFRVLESFRIDKRVLPSTYGGTRGTDIAFVITGVEHQVNRGQWVTNIKTQIYNVNDAGTINDGKNYQKFWKLGVDIGATGASSSPGSGADVISGAYSTSTDNNPYNIRPIGTSVNFNGVTGQKEGFRGNTSIGYFLVFDTLDNGVRAGMKNLLNGYFKANINTVSKIINKYAPASDGNDTANYIANVTSRMKTNLSGTFYSNITKDTVLAFAGAAETKPDNIKMFKELNKAILISEGGSFATATVDSFQISNLA